jgi:ABC-type antimicrobial peptide transport system permease subunit
VAGDLRDNGMQEPPPAIAYFPARVQNFWGAADSARGNGTFVVRTSRAGTASLVRDIERVVAGVNTDLPVSQVRRLSDVYRGSLTRTSFTLTLLLIAGSLGLVLGVIGIYGVVAYSVSQRTREVGIRLALGARRGEVTRMFLRRGLALASIGLVSGVLIATVVTRLMRSLLFGVSPVDPLTYAFVASFVLAVVTLAAYIPARRSTRAGCLEALRAD